MTEYIDSIRIDTPARVHYVDITESVVSIVRASKLTTGLAVVSSPHTTCSVVIQEESHDRTYYDTEFLMQDLTDVLESVVPRSNSEGQYHHPGPQHIESAQRLRNEEPWWSLNVDAHLRSVILGRSESIPIKDGALVLGEFGRVYFADFDQVRTRSRTVTVVAMGG